MAETAEAKPVINDNPELQSYCSFKSTDKCRIFANL